KIFAILFLIISAMVISAPSFALDENYVIKGDIKVYVNDNLIGFDVQPFFYKSRTMVPIRGVFEAMGALVEWDNYTKTVEVSKGGIEVRVQLDNPVALVNGRRISMDVPAVGLNGRIFVPVRFISEALGADVDWDNNTKTVYINETIFNKELGNILNGGRYATDGVWNYYILQDGVLVRENNENKMQEKITEGIVCDLHILDDWIYCIGVDNGIQKAMRFLKDGSSQKEIIIDKPVQSMQILNGWIYYSPNGSNILYRSSADGKVTEKILEGGDFSPKNWFVQNSFIYYINTSRAGAVCSARINGTGIRAVVYDSYKYSLKMIDDNYIYMVRDDGEKGFYRLPFIGGIPEKIIAETPLCINSDGYWLYAAVKTNNGSSLIRRTKNGNETYTINEYKESDTPKSIYLSDQSIYYTLVRGTEEMVFQMSFYGQNITALSWIYGRDYYHVRDILSNTQMKHNTLSGFASLQMTTVQTGGTTSTTIDEIKLNSSQSLYYQKTKEGNNNDLEIWVERNDIYTKKPDEDHWSINTTEKSDKVFANTSVFSLLRPTQELCNNLTVTEQEGKYILTGSGTFQSFLRSFLQEKRNRELTINDYIDHLEINAVINKDYYIEQLDLKVQFGYGDTDGMPENNGIIQYQYVNSQFNSVFLNLPYSVRQSLNAKEKADSNIESGMEKLNEAKYQEAVQYFDAAITVYNKSYDAYFYKGKALYSQGKYEEAIVTYDKCLELRPDNFDILANKGLCYLELGDLAKAEEIANAVIEANNQNKLAYNLLGLVYYKQEKFKDSYKLFEKAVAIDKNYYDACINMTSALFNMGSYTKCVNAADEFLKRFPNDRYLLLIKATSLSKQGNSRKAIEVYQQILSLDPSNDFVAMTYIALEYEKLQEFDKAQEYADRAKSVYPNYSLLVYLMEKLEYERFTLSGQKIINFIRDYYLFYNESEKVLEAISEFLNKGEAYTIGDIIKLVEAVKSPDDDLTLLLTGSDYDSYMNRKADALVSAKLENNTVHIKISDFSPGTGVYFNEYIQSVENPEDKVLIIDLRNNSSGLTSEAGIMLDTLLPECFTNYYIERGGYITTNQSGKNCVKFSKTAILVNEKTASAAELLALGLKTHLDNVAIIGRQTMGRGVGQILYNNLNRKYALFLVNHYWNVLEKNIHGTGIKVDIAVENDTDFKKAIDEFVKQ
ncbi:MAG TPA: stalk domain-containing protein, partial [Clostridia bacterium]